ncbi:hypothetical protein AVEN_182907-1 [Araneus ventricosus]|uniref:Uncharacterized protein n=1 Tax=Araneus ventricosus TaxID=182803 RepID=A0A4Y2L695_ARAVE|nr:hypothetical protein AVEN_182907-1 [Araneus ventricosus]
MVVEAFVPSVHQHIETSTEEICVNVVELQRIIQRSKEMKITWCEVQTIVFLIYRVHIDIDHIDPCDRVHIGIDHIDPCDRVHIDIDHIDPCDRVHIDNQIIKSTHRRTWS